MQSRRDFLTEEMIHDHFMCMVATLSELNMYALYLQSSPAQEAALLVETEYHPGISPVQQNILKRLEAQWDMILSLESRQDSNAMLKRLCSHTRFFNFREPLTLLAECKWQMDSRVRELLSAWHPALGLSANVEQVFNHLEDACKRSSKNATASMPCLQTLAIRSVNQRLTNGEGRARGVELAPEDFEGKQVRMIKASVWKPESLNSCNSAAFDNLS